MEPRIKSALHSLHRDGLFDSKEMYPMLQHFANLIRFIADEYESSRRRFPNDYYEEEASQKILFKGVADKYQKCVDAYHRKYIR